MRRSKEPTNPFYVALLIFGTAFALTACAYGVMTVRALHGDTVAAPPASETSPAGEWLMELLDTHGATILGGELLLLALASFAAMGTDQYWTARAARHSASASRPQETHGA